MTLFTYLARADGKSLKDYKGGVIMGQRAILSRNTAKAIRLLRYDMGITQTQLAGMIGVSTSTVKTWETGRAMPSPKHYKAIRDYLYSDECWDVYKADIEPIIERLEQAKLQDMKVAELSKIKPEDIPPMTAAATD